MFEQLLPQHFDGAYRGHRLALWIFVPLLLMKIAMGLNCIFNGSMVASSADGIPLDTFTPNGAQTVIALFAAWGLSQLVFGLLGVLVFLRYRSMVPLIFALYLLEHLSRKLVLQFIPYVKVGTPSGFWVNVVLLTLTIVGLTLSLRSAQDLQTEE